MGCSNSWINQNCCDELEQPPKKTIQHRTTYRERRKSPHTVGIVEAEKFFSPPWNRGMYSIKATIHLHWIYPIAAPSPSRHRLAPKSASRRWYPWACRLRRCSRVGIPQWHMSHRAPGANAWYMVVRYLPIPGTTLIGYMCPCSCPSCMAR